MKSDPGKIILETAAARAGYGRQQKQMCSLMHINQRTYQNRKKDSGTMTLSEIRRIDKVTPMSNDEIVRLVRGTS
ncbi:MAG: hypothetical protein IJJ38_01080 [Lachnospiraceae bacterium]|nr:hypothetical protein [Lachnospiraceae bacterium]